MLQQQTSGYAVVCDDLKKVYHGKDGNPDKFAVQGVSLALPYGECLGILGPNGAGKSSFISMVCHQIPLHDKLSKLNYLPMLINYAADKPGLYSLFSPALYFFLSKTCLLEFCSYHCYFSFLSSPIFL